MPKAAKRHVVIVVQARMGSTRLPGKVLKKILNKELLSYQLERLKRVKLADAIVVATTEAAKDEEIVKLTLKEKVSVFRGSEDDVLERTYKAAKEHQADVVVRITGDCPLIDPALVDKVIDYFLTVNPPCDYVSNTLKRTYPRGLDVEVFSFKGLEACYKNAKHPDEKEHVTPYFYRHPKEFALGNVASPLDLSKHRWTVDTLEDFELVTRMIMALYPKNREFTTEDILALLEKHPDWVEINSHVVQKSLNS